MADEPNLIDGVYQYRATIASGHKTSIQEVVEKGTGRHLAMKLVVDGKKEEVKLARAELKAEAAICKNLFHPNIIKYEGFSNSRDATYMLMEYFRAANVKSQILSELTSLHSRARPLLEGVCQGLMYLHNQGWVHLDLKPENILLNRAGEAKIIDFSLAVKFSQGIGKMLGMGGRRTIQGTRTYIAPETIMRKTLSPQTDIYSLGVTFFEIFTGKTPFQGFTPQDLLQKHLKMPPPTASSLNPNVTPEVDQLLLKMLSKKPKDRPASMQEVWGEIHRIKLFQQDVIELQATKEKEAHAYKMSLIAKVDSRTDAQRSDMLRADPTLAQQFEQEKADRAQKRRPKVSLNAKALEKAQAAKTAAAPPAMPQQHPGMAAPMMMPGMMPMQHPMYPPMMMPQQMMPQQMMPQQMMPPVLMPQPIAPPTVGAPAWMLNAPPQAASPPRGHAPPQTAPAYQAAQAPAPVPAPPSPASDPNRPVDPDTLEYMTELPDVV